MISIVPKVLKIILTVRPVRLGRRYLPRSSPCRWVVRCAPWRCHWVSLSFRSPCSRRVARALPPTFPTALFVAVEVVGLVDTLDSHCPPLSPSGALHRSDFHSLALA